MRVTVDDRNEKVNLKIREAQLQKVPYMLVVGGREAEAGQVSVRHRKRADLGPSRWTTSCRPSPPKSPPKPTTDRWGKRFRLPHKAAYLSML